MTTKTLTAAALVLTLIPVTGIAQDGPRGPQMPQFDFATADADASGGISYPEFTAYLQARMVERRAEAMGVRADRLLEVGDADGNGALTRDELISGMETLAEARRAQTQERRQGMRGDRAQMRGERGEGRGERGEEFGMRGDRGEGYGMRGHGHGHGYADRDGHGARGPGGWGRDGAGMRGMDPERMANRMFDRIDSDNDGQISPEEARVAQERMQERLQDRRGNR